MSFFTRWFKKADSDDYETLLASLASDIEKRQARLAAIRLRERRATLLVTLYALAAWFAYLGLLYSGFLPRVRPLGWAKWWEKALKSIPVLVGPIVILFTRRIVQIWYTRIGDAEEKTLRTLLKQQRAKVEEIKKKTNYYSTRNLIERYDEAAADSPLRRRSMAPQQPPTPQQRPAGVAVVQTPVGPKLQNQLSPTPPTQLMTPPRRQWYDKIADALLGDEDSSVSAAASRYALICEKCFAHNGLVKESIWEDTQYTCPKCGHFNASARSKKGRRTPSVSPGPPSPASPSAPLSPPGPNAQRSRQVSPLRPEERGGEGQGEGEALMEVDQ